MTWIIIGSVAMRHWYKDSRAPKDIDLLTPAKIVGNLPGTCIVDAQWHDVAQQIIDTSNDKVFLDSDLLYTLKVSHAHWDVHWDKTMFDIKFLRDKGAALNKDIYDALIPVWTLIHGKKKVNMNKPVDMLFDDGVKRKIDHERLHELLSFNSLPMHTELRPDSGNTWCSEDLFKQLGPTKQLETALEEMMVVAVERSNLTQRSKQSEILHAMKLSHKRLVTSMTKGWFARFLIENHYWLLYECRCWWMDHIQTKLKEHDI